MLKCLTQALDINTMHANGSKSSTKMHKENELREKKDKNTYS